MDTRRGRQSEKVVIGGVMGIVWDLELARMVRVERVMSVISGVGQEMDNWCWRMADRSWRWSLFMWVRTRDLAWGVGSAMVIGGCEGCWQGW